MGFKNISFDVLADILNTLYMAIDDYACDRRGDVGSWVREEAMRTLTMFTEQICFMQQNCSKAHSEMLFK